MRNERLGEMPLCNLMVQFIMKFSSELASIWRMTGKMWRCMGRIVEKAGCSCLGKKIQMVKAVEVEKKRRKQPTADYQWSLKVANFMY